MPFPHLCLLIPIPVLRASQSSQHLFPALLSKWEILLSPQFPKISGNPVMSIFKCIFGNNRSSIFTLKMYFSDLGIRISSVFYTKALNWSIYLVASVNEILDILGIASSWLHVPGLYSSPLQFPLNSADRFNWINRFIWPCPSTKPQTIQRTGHMWASIQTIAHLKIHTREKHKKIVIPLGLNLAKITSFVYAESILPEAAAHTQTAGSLSSLPHQPPETGAPGDSCYLRMGHSKHRTT